MSEVLIRKSMQKAVIEHALCNDRFDGGIHVLQESVLLLWMFSQSRRQSRDVIVLKQLKLGSVKLLTELRALASIGPVIVSHFHHNSAKLNKSDN